MPLTFTHRHPEMTADVAAPSRTDGLARSAAFAVVGSLFVAVCSHVAFPLPFTPVPFTLQPFAVLLVGMLLGPTAAFASMVLYLLEGALGMPVFTPLGMPGMARLLGPTGGYLFAYPVAAALAGLAATLHGRRPYLRYAAAGFAALVVIYAAGSLWFSHLLHVPFTAALSSAVLPFFVPDAVKVCAAAGIAVALKQGRQQA